MLVWIPLRKRLTQNKMDMAVLVNTLWINEVDFTASNHVIQLSISFYQRMHFYVSKILHQ